MSCKVARASCLIYQVIGFCINHSISTVDENENVPDDQKGLFKLAIQLRTFFIRLFTTLQPDMFCGLFDRYLT
jgi:hypothetical protein